jgi:cytochrome c oxidase assembly protein Cox11
VIFKGEPQPDINWDFTPVQKEVFVNAAETAIVFYKVYNR